MMNSSSIKKIYLGLMSVVAVMIVIGIFLFVKVDAESLSVSYARDMAIDNFYGIRGWRIYRFAT